jgi:hypothetical protein
MSLASARGPYDPRYDPLTEAGPGSNRDYAPSYWIVNAGAPPADDGSVSRAVAGRIDAQVSSPGRACC